MTAAIVPARRRRTLDPRLAVGVLLVLASVIGVVLVVRAADRTATVYAAADALPVGTRITAADLVPVQARLGSSASHYLAALPPASGYVATRTVERGELVPLAALGSAAAADTATVVVPVATALVSSIAPGSAVDVWAAPKQATAGTFGAPAVIVSGAVVVKVVQPSGIVPNGGGDTVELRVPGGAVARVLEALADQDSVSIVSTGAAVGG